MKSEIFLLLSLCLVSSPFLPTFGLEPNLGPKNRTVNFQQEEELTSSNKVKDNAYQKQVDAARQRWKLIFEEIKLVDNVVRNNVDGKSFFDEWKLLLDGEGDRNIYLDTTNTTKRMRQRFDGFASWEKKLQQWTDDATLSNLLLDNKSRTRKNETSLSIIPSLQFSPRPAKAGDEILPHTDIADKSKNIWIVTTASLPWFTGTAVNPLLRAAYLSTGRTEAGGSVTLMVPWLERESDRETIYGNNRIFKSPEEQEEWIRTWLRETADLKQASEELKIKWYTGRVETLENSIYSMGDITALLPVCDFHFIYKSLITLFLHSHFLCIFICQQDEVDICVLEEPEHLNW